MKPACTAAQKKHMIKQRMQASSPIKKKFN